MSDRDPWTDHQSESPTPAKKKGMSGCLLASLILGGLGLVCMVACCGGAAWIGSMIVPQGTNVPDEVTAVGQRILNREVLEEFKPDNAQTTDNILFTMHIAKFKHKEGKGQMVMGLMKIKIGDPTQASAQARPFSSPFEEEVCGSLDVKSTESHDITINGQKVSVEIREATDRVTGKAVHTASANFEQPSGQTFVVLRLDDDVWDQDAILQMLQDAKQPE